MCMRWSIIEEFTNSHSSKVFSAARVSIRSGSTARPLMVKFIMPPTIARALRIPYLPTRGRNGDGHAAGRCEPVAQTGSQLILSHGHPFDSWHEDKRRSV